MLVALHLLACATVKNTTPTMETKNDSIGAAETDTLLRRLMQQKPEQFQIFLTDPNAYRVQIIYTQIDRGASNNPTLTHHYFNHQPGMYFYPASTVKMPVAALALHRLNELKVAGLTKSSTMLTEAAGPGLDGVYNDPSTCDGRPTIEHYIKKIFLVSDNDAYNRLYEFLGQAYVNQTLHRMGYDSVQLLHRLQLPLAEEQNRTTNAVAFYDTSFNHSYSKKQERSEMRYHPRQTLLGSGYMMAGKRVDEPFDFSKKNFFRLADLHSVLQSIVLPETVPAAQRFNLTDDDYKFLWRYMSMKPGESSSPAYDTSYTDAYGKFLMFGGKGSIKNPSLRIFNKIGDAYGFLQDVAYVVDFEKGIEFMLSATVYCNSDGVFNDDKYDYETVGFPFLKNLGEAVYDYELTRQRKVKPDLSKYVFDYTKD